MMYTNIFPFSTRSMMRSFFDDDPFRPFQKPDRPEMHGFRVDVRENKDAYTLSAELPGIPLDQINITVDQDVLTISADVKSEEKTEENRCIYTERRTGHFERAFSLDGIDQSAIHAESENGVLKVTLPKMAKAEAPTARRIAIGMPGNHPAALPAEHND